MSGGWIASVHVYSSQMAQNFWTAIFAFAACFVSTVVISLATKRQKSDRELVGLVYSLTPRSDDGDKPWYQTPLAMGIAVLVAAVVLNVVFW
jgi:SSS family solute:Na+ symporter